jgi:hypothetical protein
VRRALARVLGQRCEQRLRGTRGHSERRPV